jgi:hypothetical protein
MMPYDPNEDLVPPKKIYLDDVPVLDPELGEVPFWKSLLWNTARARHEMVRNDRADGVGPAETCAPPDQLPPRPVADDTPDVRAGGLTAADLALIERAVDDLENRIGAMEARQRAYHALLDAEAQIEQELGIDSEDEDELPMQLN